VVIIISLLYSVHMHNGVLKLLNCWSPRQARSHYCQQLTLSVYLSIRMSVTLLQIASFLFLDGIEPFFDRHFSMWHSTTHSTFDLGPLMPKIYSTKFAQNRLYVCTMYGLKCQIYRRCLGLTGGFQGWPIQWNHAKCCGADPCCHGNEIWARREDPVAYRLVWLFSLSLEWIVAECLDQSTCIKIHFSVFFSHFGMVSVTLSVRHYVVLDWVWVLDKRGFRDAPLEFLLL